MEEEMRRLEEERRKANEAFKKPSSPSLALTNKTSNSTNNTIKIQPGLSSSTVILSRDIIGKVSKPGGSVPATEESVIMWNPSETKGENGAVAINYKTHGALTKLFLKPTIPFMITYGNPQTVTGDISASISLMSFYHPFPLRVDNVCEQNRQYDACLQIGEFSSERVTGSKIVLLIPLKVAVFAGESGVFVNAVANKLPAILGQQPDKVNGYPDVPAQPGADWMLDKVINTKRGFYTWTNKDGTQVVVMATPVHILISDMANIKKLPITSPEDVIHEIGQVLYKPSPPINCITGQETGCKPSITDILNNTQSCANPDALREFEVKSKKDSETFYKVLFSILGIALLILTVWLGIRFAMGPGKTLMSNIGDSLGRSLAGGYDALKKVNLPTVPAMPKIPKSIKTTRRNLGKRLGLGATGNFGTKRQTPTDKSIDDMFPVIEPSSDIEMTNPLFKSKDDFAKFQERNRTRKNPKQGTIGAIANLPAENIPEPSASPAPAPVPSVERIIDDMPAGVTVNPVVARRRSAQNTRKSSVGSIKNLPQITSAKPPENTPAAISNLPTPTIGRVSVAKQLNSVLNESSKNPALAEIEDLQKSDERRKQAKSNALRKISASSQARKSQSKSFKDIANRARAVNEIDDWESPAPAPAPAPAPGVNKLWQKRFAKRDQQKANPKPVFKGGRKLRNRRKTGHQLRNRKKTGRKI